jgi:transposase-like protein
MQEVGFRLLNDIVWQKPAPPPNLSRRLFTHATELVLWATKARKGKERYTFNYQLMRTENGGKQMRNVWRFAPASGAEKRFGKHPTQKPVALIERCLRASTTPGSLVLDPFAGSVSTGVAALLTGRRFLCIEKAPTYAQIGARRLAVASLEQRVHLENKGALHADLLPKRCPACLREDRVIRSGTNHGRSVRYYCKRCQRYFTLAPKQRGYDGNLKQKAVLLARKGKGMRVIGRRLGVHHQTVSNWVAKYQASVPTLRK